MPFVTGCAPTAGAGSPRSAGTGGKIHRPGNSPSRGRGRYGVRRRKKCGWAGPPASCKRRKAGCRPPPSGCRSRRARPALRPPDTAAAYALPPQAAQGQLGVVGHGAGVRVDALAQRVQRAGQRTRLVDHTGPAFQKAAVAGLGAGGQAQGGQATLRRDVAFAECLRHNAGRQIQPPCDAVQIVPRQPQVPALAAAAAATRTHEGKLVPRGQGGAQRQSFTAAPGLHGHRRTSQGQSSPAAKAAVASKALCTMLATFTSV